MWHFAWKFVILLEIFESKSGDEKIILRDMFDQELQE